MKHASGILENKGEDFYGILFRDLHFVLVTFLDEQQNKIDLFHCCIRN